MAYNKGREVIPMQNAEKAPRKPTAISILPVPRRTAVGALVGGYFSEPGVEHVQTKVGAGEALGGLS